jgi:hypothetical protein
MNQSKMEQMLERLLAGQAQMKAELKADKEEMEAKMKANQQELMAKVDATQLKMDKVGDSQEGIMMAEPETTMMMAKMEAKIRSNKEETIKAMTVEKQRNPVKKRRRPFWTRRNQLHHFPQDIGMSQSPPSRSFLKIHDQILISFEDKQDL